MPGTVKSELLPDADRSHKCDCQEKVSWKRNLPLDKSHFITENGEKILEKVVLRRSMGLCHGNFGNLFLMKECSEKLQLGSNITSNFEKNVKKLLSEEILLMPKEQLDYGLMQGISGVGYACLRLQKR